MKKSVVFLLIFLGTLTQNFAQIEEIIKVAKGMVSEGNITANFDKSVVYKTAVLPVVFKVSESNESMRVTAISNIRRNILGVPQFNLVGERLVKEAINTVPEDDENALMQYLGADAVVTCVISQEAEGKPLRADVEIRTASGDVLYSGRGRGKTFVSLEGDSEIAIKLALQPLRIALSK